MFIAQPDIRLPNRRFVKGGESNATRKPVSRMHLDASKLPVSRNVRIVSVPGSGETQTVL